MNFKIEKADLIKNKDEIIKFWNRNFSGWPSSKYTWFYRENPFGSAQCWIVRDSEDNLIVGATAVFPRKFQVKDQCVTSGITGDFGMDKKHRILGPALKIQKAALPENGNHTFDFLYGYPNDRSEPVQRRAGFKIVGSTYRMVKILKSFSYVRRHVKSDILSKLLSMFLDLGLRISGRESYQKNQKRYRIEELSEFDYKFDELWKKSINNYTVIGERSSDFLNWRFTQCPYVQFKIFALSVGQTRDIIGYVVYYISNKNVNIADLFVVNMKEFIDPLLSSFINYIRKKDCESVSVIYLGSDEFVNKLKEYRFSIRGAERKIVAYAPKESPIAPYIFDKNNWHLMEGDND